MVKNTEFPWDLLKAECLRLVCNQLVQGSSEELNNYPIGRKEDMIEFLRDVQARSLDAAVRDLERPARKAASAHEASSPGKRKNAQREDEPNGETEGADGYNTRFKGVKRVKVREATPERTSRTPRKPRKSITAGDEAGTRPTPKSSPQKNADESISTGPVKRGRGRPRKSVNEGGPTPGTSAPQPEGDKPSEPVNGEPAHAEPASVNETVKRGRGRPRKSDADAPKTPVTPKTPKTPKPPVLDADGNPKRGRGRPRKSVATEKPVSKGKQVFDGVLLEKRKSTAKDGVVADTEVVVAPGIEDDDEEEDAVLAAVNRGIVDADGASSLGGSNKENDPIDPFRYTPEHDADMDADGDPEGETEPITTTATVV